MKTKLLKFAALLAVTIAVSRDGVELSSMTVPGSSFWGIELQTLSCDTTDQVAVDCGTPTIKTPAYQTGPFLPMCVSTATASDCYIADGINPNGSLINERWVGHP